MKYFLHTHSVQDVNISELIVIHAHRAQIVLFLTLNPCMVSPIPTTVKSLIFFLHFFIVTVLLVFFFFNFSAFYFLHFFSAYNSSPTTLFLCLLVCILLCSPNLIRASYANLSLEIIKSAMLSSG